MANLKESINHEIKATVPMLWLHGEWCKNEGHNGGSYFVFRRRCGEAYFLNKDQLEELLNNLIQQF